MPKYVAFLRAINVGVHTVKMDRIRHMFEEMEFADVETYIASGNVIFDSKSSSEKTIENKVENYLRKTLGYEVSVFLRTISELTEISEYRPFDKAILDTIGNSLYIAFLKQKPTEVSKKKLLSLTTRTDDFHINEREFYWLCRTRMMESSFSGALLEKIIGTPATLRNSTTVKKIVAKYY